MVISYLGFCSFSLFVHVLDKVTILISHISVRAFNLEFVICVCWTQLNQEPSTIYCLELNWNWTILEFRIAHNDSLWSISHVKESSIDFMELSSGKYIQYSFTKYVEYYILSNLTLLESVSTELNSFQSSVAAQLSSWLNSKFYSMK